MPSSPVRNGSKFPLVFSSKLLLPPLLQITVRFLVSLSSHSWGAIIVFPRSFPVVETEEILFFEDSPIENTSVQIASAAFVSPFTSLSYKPLLKLHQHLRSDD